MEAIETFECQGTTAVVGAEKHCYTVEDLQIILGTARGTAYKPLERHEFHWFKAGSTYRISRKGFDERLDSKLQSVRNTRSTSDILIMETGIRYDLARS